MTKANIWLTEQDYVRLRRMLAERSRQAQGESPELDSLEESLELAHVVQSDRVPGNVVTMNSRVRFEDARSGEPGTVTIVYPQDANASSGRISVLSPVGGALIGAVEGEEVELPLPHGQTRRIRINSVLYQPEAAGNYSL